MKIIIRRLYKSDVQTRGMLEVRSGSEGVFRCNTLELPWRENKNRVSCIPVGYYELSYRPAERSGTYDYDHFLVEGVEDRSYILIHSGNLYTQILGCVLVGDRFVDINGDGHPDVTNSRETLEGLRSAIGEEIRDEGSLPMEIQDAYEGRFATERSVPEEEPQWDGLVAGLETKAVEIPDHIPDQINPTP